MVHVYAELWHLQYLAQPTYSSHVTPAEAKLRDQVPESATQIASLQNVFERDPLIEFQVVVCVF